MLTLAELQDPDEAVRRFTPLGFHTGGMLSGEDAARYQQRVVAAVELSSPTPRTGCGVPTSPSIPPARQGLLLRGPGRVQPPGRRLVDRGPPALRAGRRRAADGHLAAATRSRDHRARGPGQPAHRLGLRSPSPPGGTARQHGPGGQQRRRFDDPKLPVDPATRAARHPPLADQKELALAIFDWIEARYNPRRRHTSLGMLSPVEFEPLHGKTAAAA